LTIKFKNNFHLFFLLILSINYFFPLIVFGEITLFYIDALDIEIVYNYILGKIYGGDINSVNAFLAGEIKPEYLRRLFQPFSLVYLFDAELAYWIIDILVKVTGYISFYILSKKIIKDNFVSALGAALFSSMNLPTHEGFYIAIFPYLIYLIFFKKQILLKHYFLIFIFGLNSDILRTPYFVPVTLMLFWVFGNKSTNINSLKNLIKVSIIFLTAVIISNSNIIYTVLTDGPFHRQDWLLESESITLGIKNIIESILRFDIWPFFIKYSLGQNLPSAILIIPLLFPIFFLKNKQILKIFFIILIIKFTVYIFLKSDLLIDFLNSNFLGLKNYSFSYIDKYDAFMFLLIFVYVMNEKFKLKKYLIFSSFISLLLFQVNSSIGPIYKKYFVDSEEKFRNYYTFNGFYLPEVYGKIKKIVGEERVLSIGYEPLVAVMNDIKAIDGYHTLYPLEYKKKFRKVIKDELDSNKFWKKYYDNWGSRVYAFVADPEEIKINFEEAKKLGASFVISRYSINSKKLKLICESCKNDGVYLYKIV